MGTTPTPDTVSVHFFLSNLVVGKNVIFENLIYPVSFRIIYFCQFVSIDVVLLHLARTLGNVVYYVKKKKKMIFFFFFFPQPARPCWVVPSSVILHFSALSHRIESGFDKSPLMSTPFFVLAACSED